MPVLVAVALAAVLALVGSSRAASGAEGLPEPELFPGRVIASCEVRERPATSIDAPAMKRSLVLTEPADWKNVPGPHGERAVFWKETIRRHGFRILDRRGRQLHVLHHVNRPRWSPDGRWLAVSHWSRELPYQLALVEVRTGKVIRITHVQHLDDCAWSPDSRKLAFVARAYAEDGISSAGWVSVPDTRST